LIPMDGDVLIFILHFHLGIDDDLLFIH
jgi:hypothetical protein